ncbi:hypothetical protein E2C01_026604 [Portunus trituberculatus]|uniref:Uncharacterized protein n=1 Tax=Portunus trituberculatus TaxID=210409 RepID=A0A5B7EFT8_PORTR|nr:hypothetical protein [Portunus trituberculatus]
MLYLQCLPSVPTTAGLTLAMKHWLPPHAEVQCGWCGSEGHAGRTNSNVWCRKVWVLVLVLLLVLVGKIQAKWTTVLGSYSLLGLLGRFLWFRAATLARFLAFSPTTKPAVSSAATNARSFLFMEGEGVPLVLGNTVNLPAVTHVEARVYRYKKP